ncbi:hypothetical protein MR781_08375 [bacterium]|uniref:hypothetical protein n=1 Tax=Lachnospiraceae TaxID=186803 RepID=UPI002A7E566A|nr:hypothetical protein [bacterium]MDY2885967.1 hypothetical protein [Bariatricus sp.]MCI7150545.1 hypothetical protein [bacterium]MDD7143150.1 hypothetical protein [bacterium]MDY4194312.1 hypothetical protein [Bariatricus sp.]
MWVCIAVYFILGMVCIVLRYRKLLIHYDKKLWKTIFYVMFCAATIALLTEISGQGVMQNFGKVRINREDYGGNSVNHQLQMQIEGEKSENVEIQVSPRMYSEEEVQSLFRQAMNKLDQVILGENETADHVVKPLCFPQELEGYPFAISWEPGRYDVMDMNGRINQDAVLEEDPEGEGVLVKITGILRYGTEEAAYNTQVLVFADVEETETIRNQVLNAARQAEEVSREEKSFVLPEQVNGRTVRWRFRKESKVMPVLMLGAVICVFLVVQERQKKEKLRKDRKEQMLFDYPEIVSQFTMLMGAGMTAKNVWKKITADYCGQKERGGRVRDAYEEMVITLQEMQSGIPEAECYERFAARCGLVPYMKMGALLSQNLRKGAKGTSDMLKMEAIQAMEDRKSRARRLGEEAGVKLLLPMLLMLVIVLVIVVVPAFLSIDL